MRSLLSLLLICLASLLWAFEGLEPSSIYNGSVDVIMGNYVEHAVDLTTRGLEPLRVVRGVCGAADVHTSESVIGWNMGQPRLHTSFKTPSGDALGLSRMVVSDMEGGMALFEWATSCWRAVVQNGYCNTGLGEISGKTNLRNRSIHRSQEGEYRVKTGSGEELYYGGPFREGYYPLLRMAKPNGHRLEVENDFERGLIKGVTAWNSDRSELLGSLQYRYELPTRYTIRSSDGQWVRYEIGESGRLNSVWRSDMLTIWYTYETENLHRYSSSGGSHRITRVKRGENYLKNRYYHARENLLSCGRKIYLEGRERRGHKVDHPAVGRICEQFAPVAPDGSSARVASYEYHFDWAKKWDPSTLAGRTEVLDAYGNRSTFHYSTHKRLTQIDHFQGSDERISTEYYVYAHEGNEYGNLLAKAVCDDAPILATTLEYDERGNVIAERLWGDLTGESRAPLQLDRNHLPIDNGVDWWEKRFIYSGDNRLQVAIDGSKRTEYTYWGETDLEESRLVYDGERLIERHSYRYDKNGALIEYIWEKGGQRRTRRITPVESGVAIGLPKRVEEWYWEGEERLLGAIEYEYDKRNLVIAETIVDAANTPRYTLYTDYDSGGRPTRRTDPLGRETRYSYTPNGYLSSERMPGSATQHSYDRADRRIKTTTGEWKELEAIHFRYDLMGNCVEVEDRLGTVVKTEFGALGRPLVQRLPYLRRFTYNGVGQRISEENGLGEMTRRRYTARGDLAEELLPDGTTSRCIYSLRGLPICKVSPDGVETHLSYDGMDHLVSLSIRSPGGALQRDIRFRYEGDSLVYSRDGEGNERYYEYDGAGRLIAERCGESWTGYKYDALGRVCCTILATSSKERREEWREYDLLNQVIEERIQDGEGRVLRRVGYAYDERGNQTEVITYADGLKRVKSTEYDSLNRPIRVIDELGNKTLIEHRVATTVLGRLAETVVTDSLGGRTTTRADSFGNELSVEKIDSFGVTLSHVETRYDVAGRRVEQRTALVSQDGQYATHALSWSRGLMGRIEGVDEGGRRTQYAYNQFNQLTTKILPSGELVQYGYDGLGRLSDESGPGYRYHFSYDRNDNIIRVEDDQGRETVRSFDQHNWLVSEQQNGLTITYSRDRIGRPTDLKLPDSSSLFFRYDAAGMTALGRKGGYEHLYTERDLSGRILKERLIGEVGEVRRVWDGGGGLLTSEGAGLTEKLRYDPLGRLAGRLSNGRRQEYRYDGLSQLSSETGAQLIDHIFNSIGNRNRPDASYNLQNELEGDEYRHQNGCLVASPNREARFDGRGRLIEATVDGRCYHYAYDAFDRRIEERCGDRHTLYLYDGEVEIAALQEGRIRELRLLGEGIASDVGAMVAIELEGVPYAVRSDYRGSVAALLDLSGELLEEYRYTAFGEEGSGGSCPWRFSSKRVDETGLIYFGRRHYDPLLGRWISPDPLGHASGPNLYLYCGNDPVNAIDPDGRLSLGLMRSEFDYVPERVPMFDNKPLPKRYPPATGPPPTTGKNPPVVHVHYERHWAPPSRPFQIQEPSTAKEFGKGRLMMVNGMMTGYQTALDNGRMISEAAGNANVHGIWNATHGIWKDGAECFLNLYRYFATESVRLMQKEWNDFFMKADPDGLIYIICHSQGAILVRNALLSYDEELRKRIVVLAIAPGAYIDEEICGRITHLVSDLDPVTWFDFPGRLRCAKTTIHVKRHPDAPRLFDHAFRSPSYTEQIERWLKYCLKL